MSVKGFKLSNGTVEQYDYNYLANKPSSSGDGLTADVKQAILDCFQNVAWVSDDGQDYYDALYDALYPPAGLSSITCVYTQSGTVYTTDSLNSLKDDLVVTAHYDNSTTAVITNYTLSGTLTEGTSTITVSYGGKTTTFSVTVTVFTTAPRIAEYDKAINSSGTITNTTGACYTEGYDYQIDTTALKATTYYDSTNNYMSTAGTIFKIKYVTTNPDDISFGSSGKFVYSDTSDTLIDYNSPTRTGAESNATDSRYKSGYFTLSNDTLRIRFSLATASLANSYAYFITTQSGVMPVGVSDGDIIFAGANTSYYGKHNIND